VSRQNSLVAEVPNWYFGSRVTTRAELNEIAQYIVIISSLPTEWSFALKHGVEFRTETGCCAEWQTLQFGATNCQSNANCKKKKEEEKCRWICIAQQNPYFVAVVSVDTHWSKIHLVSQD
jgi:hypothetical protein